MLPVTIDPALCKKDELCIHECPLSVLTSQGKGNIPEVHPKKAKYCINCGHCAAICPTNAITLNAFADQETIAFDPADIPDFKSVETLIKTRRSIRKFKKKPIKSQEIEELISLSSYAPSGHNAQPVSWTIIDTPEKVQEVAELIVEWMDEAARMKNPMDKKLFLSGLVNAYKKGNDVICRNAPALVAAWAPIQGITPEADTVLATGYVELAAHAKGLGACWAGYLVLAAAHSEKIRSFLGVPEGHIIHGALLMGYPAVKYRNMPARHKASAEKYGEMTILKARENGH